jgi:hypothetical protein
VTVAIHVAIGTHPAAVELMQTRRQIFLCSAVLGASVMACTVEGEPGDETSDVIPSDPGTQRRACDFRVLQTDQFSKLPLSNYQMVDRNALNLRFDFPHTERRPTEQEKLDWARTSGEEIEAGVHQFLDGLPEDVRETIGWRTRNPSDTTASYDQVVTIDMERPINPRSWAAYNDGTTPTRAQVFEAFKRRLQAFRKVFPHARLGLWNVGRACNFGKDVATNEEIAPRDAQAAYEDAGEFGVYDDIDFGAAHGYVGRPDDVKLACPEGAVVNTARLRKSADQNRAPLGVSVVLGVCEQGDCADEDPIPVAFTKKIIDRVRNARDAAGNLINPAPIFFWMRYDQDPPGTGLNKYLRAVREQCGGTDSAFCSCTD